MPVNDKIRVPDYNDIQSKVAGVLGTGSGNSGYGQSLRSSAVSESTRVTINEWGNLRWDILNAFRHIYGSDPVTVVPAVGNTVRYDTDFAPSSNMALEAPVTQYDTYANTLIANRFTIHPSQSATASAGSNSTTWPGAFGDFWTSRIESTVLVSWPSSNAARHFFNSGGEIRIVSSRSGGSSTQQNTSWTNILNTAGTKAFGGNLPGTGTSPLDAQNWFRCTSSFQQWHLNGGSTPYGSNFYRISARTPGVANNSSGTASSVEFLLEYIDNYVDPGNSGLGDTPDTIDAVDGTFTVSISYLYASGVLEPPGSGNFTVTQPTVTIGAPRT